uniref:Uncharacterized protein n=1 Tax=Panagrolaimus superbus TaxID=310955 RepID=A0A914YW80_9BILA
MQPMNFSVIAQDAVNYVAVASGHKLYIKQHHLLPSLDATINQSLAQGQLAKYPYTRSLVSSHFIGPGRHDYNTSLFTDYVPKRVFVALVDASAFKGAPLLSPFDFKPFGLDRIHVSVNNKIVPTYPYDLGRKEFARAFKDLTDNTTNTGLTYQKYLTHSCIFAFDFQHYHSDKAIDPQQTGTTALSLKFASAVPTSGIQAIVYSEFDSIISFDFARNNTTALPV